MIPYVAMLNKNFFGFSCMIDAYHQQDKGVRALQLKNKEAYKHT